MEYGQILRRTWQITWNYKFLWVFGIAIALCRGQGFGGGNFNFVNNLPGEETQNGAVPITPGDLRQFEQFVNSPAFLAAIVGLVVLILALSVISIAIGAYARGALVRSVNRIENGEEVDFRQAWQEGRTSFNPLFWLELILSLPLLVIGFSIFVIILVGLINLISSTTRGAAPSPDEIARQIGLFAPLAIVAICGLICLGLIIQLLVAIFTVFGSRAIILEGRSVTASFGRAWEVFIKNLGPILLLVLILFGINLVIGIIVAIPIAILFGGIIIISIGAAASGAWPLLVIIVGMVFVIAILSALVGGVYRVFVETLWTLVYRQLVGLAQPSGLDRTTSGMPELTSP